MCSGGSTTSRKCTRQWSMPSWSHGLSRLNFPFFPVLVLGAAASSPGADPRWSAIANASSCRTLSIESSQAA